ncbi:hypothetical protein Nepgr_031412 [Nepenthes gracilis]|uniref:Uncharacterized protein n=1 Tax=Nepenthes gracilis TaxID=150966 RepID=A0AAD3TI81_NEPGR|nr:hypothetical protein Nepgr_031412 [Nepenthes gracilis]
MRTRFLAIDYFKLHETPTFLRLPIPRIPSLPKLASFEYDEELVRCFGSHLAVCLQLDSLPIDNALSKFISDSLPHTIDSGNGVLPIAGRLSADVSGTDFRSVEVQASEAELDHKVHTGSPKLQFWAYNVFESAILKLCFFHRCSSDYHPISFSRRLSLVFSDLAHVGSPPKAVVRPDSTAGLRFAFRLISDSSSVSPHLQIRAHRLQICVPYPSPVLDQYSPASEGE